jgi:uncharacterized protein
MGARSLTAARCGIARQAPRARRGQPAIPAPRGSGSHWPTAAQICLDALPNRSTRSYYCGVKVFLLTFGLFLIAVLAMSVGVLLGRPRLKGSCGGVDREGRPIGDCACAQAKLTVCATTATSPGTQRASQPASADSLR